MANDARVFGFLHYEDDRDDMALSDRDKAILNAVYDEDFIAWALEAVQVGDRMEITDAFSAGHKGMLSGRASQSGTSRMSWTSLGLSGRKTSLCASWNRWTADVGRDIPRKRIKVTDMRKLEQRQMLDDPCRAFGVIIASYDATVSEPGVTAPSCYTNHRRAYLLTVYLMGECYAIHSAHER